MPIVQETYDVFAVLPSESTRLMSGLLSYADAVAYVERQLALEAQYPRYEDEDPTLYYAIELVRTAVPYAA